MYLEEPDPRVGGDIHIYNFHHGKDNTGCDFRDTLPNHHVRIIKLFTTFLKDSFGELVLLLFR